MKLPAFSLAASFLCVSLFGSTVKADDECSVGAHVNPDPNVCSTSDVLMLEALLTCHKNHCSDRRRLKEQKQREEEEKRRKLYNDCETCYCDLCAPQNCDGGCIAFCDITFCQYEPTAAPPCCTRRDLEEHKEQSAIVVEHDQAGAVVKSGGDHPQERRLYESIWVQTCVDGWSSVASSSCVNNGGLAVFGVGDCDCD